jgi:fluoride exporter
MLQYLYIAIGGALGAILRFALSKWQHNNWLPWHTLVTNILGCFIIGCCFSLLQTNKISSNLYALLAIGICGGFTTFSTFGLENYQYLKDSAIQKAIIYIFASVSTSLLAVLIGIKLINFLQK